MEYISSKNNDKIKYAAKLVSDSSFRKTEAAFVTEGLRLCVDAAVSGIEIKTLFVTEKAFAKNESQLKSVTDVASECFIISDDVAVRLSDTKTTQGIFCLCKTIDKSDFIDKINYNGIYIAVENLQTPDNLGSVVRTAEALGLDGIIVSGGCDIYNPKALRASMGSLFRLPVILTDNLPDLICGLKSAGMRFYAAVPDCGAVKITEIEMGKGCVCVIGNEGNGLTVQTVNVCDCSVTIPMKGRAESLNASAAASVIMWEMVR